MSPTRSVCFIFLNVCQVPSAKQCDPTKRMQRYFKHYTQATNLFALGILSCLALRMLGNTQEAEDLTQEVFIALVRGNTYNPKWGSVVVFLTTMTRSRAIDHHRQMRSQRQLLERWRRSL